MNWTQHFKLLLWKNFILQKRRPVATAVELLLPLFFSVILILIRSSITLTEITEITTWKEFTVDHLPAFEVRLLPRDYVWTVAYAPDNVKQFNDIMQQVETRLNTDIPKSPLEEKCGFDARILMNLAQNNNTSVAENRTQQQPQQNAVGTQPPNSNRTSRNRSTADNASAPNLNQILACIGRNTRRQRDSSSEDGSMSNGEGGTMSMANVLNLLEVVPAIKLEPFSSEDEFLRYVANDTQLKKTLAGVIFSGMDENNQTIPNDLRVTLRFHSDPITAPVRSSALFSGLSGTLPSKAPMASVMSTAHKTERKCSIKPFVTLPVLPLGKRRSALFTSVVDSGESCGRFACFEKSRNTWHTTMLFPDFQAPYPRSNKSDTGGLPYYYKEGFLSLLHAVNLAIGDVVTNTTQTWNTTNTTFGLKRYPYPPYVNDIFIIAIQNTLPLMIMLSFFYTSLVIVRSIVREKESKLKEYMIMMGLSNWLHWLGWFVKYFLFLSISCIVMSGLFKIEVSKGSILNKSDFSVILVFFLLFSIATINFCFLISVFFSKANVGAAAGGVIYALSYMPYLFISNDFSSFSTSVKLTASLVSNIAMASGWNLVGLFEGKAYDMHHLVWRGQPRTRNASLLSRYAGHYHCIFGERYYSFGNDQCNKLAVLKLSSAKNRIVRMFFFVALTTLLTASSVAGYCGVQWSNIHSGITVDNDFSMLHVFLMLILDAVLYMLIAIYIEGVWPGDYGLPKPWYFPFTRIYWFGPKKVASLYKLIGDVDAADNEETPGSYRVDKQYFEPYPPNLNPTVKIKGLRKVYQVNRKDRVAVHNLHLNMYDGQITVLLGHNGAGKTTTMSMLTGFFPPTSGDAIVNGHSITNDIKGVRESMGLCPQFNILFDLLTVDEHIYFFARLKGLDAKDAEKEVENAKISLKLTDKGSAQSRHLSGGMKRKLSVGIALCAGSKYIILDEPTSGMDPAARRAIWDVLQIYRPKCSILLSTHFMDEADLLGDRIAIMAEGKLRCSGSPVFLKNKFGVGYHIVLTKSPHCDIAKLTELIQSHVPETRLERLSGAELSFVLPFHASPHFSKLFEELDEKAASLGISGYGAIVTTMEEVFLRVTEDSFTAVSKISTKVTDSYAAICRSSQQSAGTRRSTFEQASIPEKDAIKRLSSRSETHEQSGVGHDNDLAALQQETDDLPDGKEGLENSALIPDDFLPSDAASVGHSQSDDVTPHPSTGFAFVETSANFPNPINGTKEVTSSVYLESKKQLNTGVVLWCQQFYALVVKNMLHSKRNYKVAIAQLVVPVFFAVLAILSVKYPPFERKNVSLDLSLNAYGPNYVLVGNLDNTAFGNAYKEQFKGTEAQSEVYSQTNFETHLSNLFQELGGDFNANHLVSGSFNETGNSTHSTAWFNNQAFHTPATSIAYMDQAYLRYTTHRSFMMSYHNFPLPRNSTKRIQQQLLGSLSGFFVGFFIVLGFSFLSASFCIFLVRERVDRSALLQALAGVEPFCFWLSAFVWDIINYLIPCVLIIVMFYVFDVEEFTNHVGVTLLLFILYCFSSLPLMYLLSFLFDVPSTALVRVTMLNVIIGAASVVTINFLRILEMTDVADGLNWFFLFMPPYCLGMGLADVYVNDRMVNACTVDVLTEFICQDMNITYQTNFLAWPAYGVGKYAAFLLIQAAIFFAVLLMFQYQLHRIVLSLLKIKNKKVVAVGVEAEDFDDDVDFEARRIEQMDRNQIRMSDQLILSKLCKVYGGRSQSIVAVQNLSIGISKGECFGLLGINGAGKTTTFKMLTGDHQPTSGTAYLDGYDVTKQQRKAQQRMGYCPQFDGLIDQMTGAETIRMFARLRGVREKDIPRNIKELGTMLHFAEHLDKECGKYSGGNKRKLSTAIALVGDPPVVLLDEPSTGMDPGARRMLWDALTLVRTSGRSIVITSHSMEECEALCTKIGIMVNGRLRCLGGPQHLKNKFGQGYTAEITSLDVDVRSVMKRYFPGCVLKDEHSGVLTYNIPEIRHDQSKLNLAKVFDLMERAKNESKFGNYTVTQTTLEQVFLRLVRWQRESIE